MQKENELFIRYSKMKKKLITLQKEKQNNNKRGNCSIYWWIHCQLFSYD
jgi:hypothetical protein